MVKRPHSAMAAIAAVLAVLGVLMPWCTVTVDAGSAGSRVYTHNGFDCEFRGTPIIILAGIGALVSTLVAATPAASLPVRPRYLLILAAGPLLVASFMSLMAFLQESGTCGLKVIGTVTETGQGPGIWITLIFSGGAGLTALWGAMTRAAPELDIPPDADQA